MSQAQYKVVSIDGVRFATIYQPGEAPIVVTDESHTNLDEIIAAARNGEDITPLVDVGKNIQRKFDDVAIGRVAVRNDKVYFDDDEMDNSVTKAILAFLDEGADVTPLVKFMENVMANPQEHSREQFYRWIEYHDFPIDDEGCIVAYKGLTSDGKGGYQSLHSGAAFVNGVEVKGQIPNAVGDVITMPRSVVQHDPNVGCHRGLHAGTWEYASSFGRGATMHVRINPRDVVSVPHDCTSQKVRVCRYEVLSIAEQKFAGAYYVQPDDVDDDEFYDDDFECDCGYC